METGNGDKSTADTDLYLPQTDSFWEVGQPNWLLPDWLYRFAVFLRRQINKYSRVVKRCDDGNKLTTDLLCMINERAELEKAFSKMLKGWSKKWSEYVVKCERVSSELILIFVLSLSSSTWIRLDDSSLESTYERSRYVSWRSSDRPRWITSRCYPGDQVMAKNEIHQIDDAY